MILEWIIVAYLLQRLLCYLLMPTITQDEYDRLKNAMTRIY